MKRSDCELIESACRGDVESFGELYQRYYRMAVGITRSRLSDLHLAEDAAQESFAIACRSLSTLQDRNQFRHWLGTICRRTAGKMATSRLKLTSLPHDEEIKSDDQTNPLGDDIQIAIAQLDDTAREIVLLHYFSNLSYEEIGCALGLSPQAIHGRLQRARRKLATLLRMTGIQP